MTPLKVNPLLRSLGSEPEVKPADSIQKTRDLEAQDEINDFEKEALQNESSNRVWMLKNWKSLVLAYALIWAFLQSCDSGVKVPYDFMEPDAPAASTELNLVLVERNKPFDLSIFGWFTLAIAVVQKIHASIPQFIFFLFPSYLLLHRCLGGYNFMVYLDWIMFSLTTFLLITSYNLLVHVFVPAIFGLKRLFVKDECYINLLEFSCSVSLTSPDHVYGFFASFFVLEFILTLYMYDKIKSCHLINTHRLLVIEPLAYYLSLSLATLVHLFYFALYYGINWIFSSLIDYSENFRTVWVLFIIFKGFSHYYVLDFFLNHLATNILAKSKVYQKLA